MSGLSARFVWRLRTAPAAEPAFLAAGAGRGLSHRLLTILAARGHADPAALTAFLDTPQAGLHDPLLLPDADAFRDRVRAAVARSEKVLVFGDFDADGLTGLAILLLTLRQLGLDVRPYVPDRATEGHGLQPASLRHAAAERRTLLVTVDCGTSNRAEIDAARAMGIDVLVTDHHQLTAPLPSALAVVNPRRPDSRYPEDRLAGSGVAFKLAQLLLGPDALDLADLAAIGTVADVAVVAGENRAIVRLGLERLRNAPRPGLAALMERAGINAARLDLDGIAYALAPRLNAVGRVGDALRAAELLLADDAREAATLA
ncbi:MAG: DHH family phosphoesterase, partial [Chloroflexota bacterium]|nr:DHH family phosphoesterase [Chloroflexota bacterium]